MIPPPRPGRYTGFSASETAPDVPRYERREKVGEGASVVVYRAWDGELKRMVALKVLRDGAGMSELARTRFRREARTAAGLDHPNLVKVYDAGEAAGQLYIVMEEDPPVPGEEPPPVNGAGDRI